MRPWKSSDRIRNPFFLEKVEQTFSAEDPRSLPYLQKLVQRLNIVNWADFMHQLLPGLNEEETR